MAEKEQTNKPTRAQRERFTNREVADRTSSTSSTSERTNSKRSSEILSKLDDLLDEIDEVLEINAEDFVKSYVQKGGQ